jgi:glucose uptake protein GlcU
MKRRPKATQKRVSLGALAIIVILLGIYLSPARAAGSLESEPSTQYWVILCCQLSGFAFLWWAYKTWPPVSELAVFLARSIPDRS